MADIEVQTCCSKCLTKRLLHVHTRLYVSGRVEATLRYRFKTYKLKLPPWSQSYIGTLARVLIISPQP